MGGSGPEDTQRHAPEGGQGALEPEKQERKQRPLSGVPLTQLMALCLEVTRVSCLGSLHNLSSWGHPSAPQPSELIPNLGDKGAEKSKKRKAERARVVSLND